MELGRRLAQIGAQADDPIIRSAGIKAKELYKAMARNAYGKVPKGILLGAALGGGGMGLYSYLKDKK
jgi:hypothetical protein